MFGGGGGGGGGDEYVTTTTTPSSMMMMMMSPTAKERGATTPQQQPQWGKEETRELIRIRGELERDFEGAGAGAGKRKKTLWEVVSAKMREKGYRRTPDQCKCKWKNLLNRYKGKETSDPENGRDCPFFEELQAVFAERAKNMQRLLLESEAGSTQASKRVKTVVGDRSSDEFLIENEDEDEDESEEEKPVRSNSKRKKGERTVLEKPSRTSGSSNTNSSSVGDIQLMLKDFLQQQQRMDLQWREMMERRSRERQLFEQEWRHSMEKLERERILIEQAWREREEQRRIREESRAERRDALLTTLLNKLIQENNL